MQCQRAVICTATIIVTFLNPKPCFQVEAISQRCHITFLCDKETTPPPFGGHPGAVMIVSESVRVMMTPTVSEAFPLTAFPEIRSLRSSHVNATHLLGFTTPTHLTASPWMTPTYRAGRSGFRVWGPPSRR